MEEERKVRNAKFQAKKEAIEARKMTKQKEARQKISK